MLACALWSTEEKAKECAKRGLRLELCEHCGFIENRIFDAKATQYSEYYENALHFSSVYRNYSKQEATRLLDKYELRQKNIVDIGCGDGRFLALLCQLGECQGRGFDPSYAPEKDDQTGADEETRAGLSRVQIVPEYYGPQHADVPCDLMISKHVLEHIPAPVDFMRGIRRAIGARAIPLYFEMPNMLYALDNLSLWDVIYEHCSYFTAPSLALVLRRAGFLVNDVRVTYSEQCLTIEATPSDEVLSNELTQAEQASVAEIVRKAQLFGDQAAKRIDDCRAAVETLAQEGARIALWGAGARATSYLNMAGASAIQLAVDINPRKHGKFIPGTGQRIVAPEELRQFQPDVVMLMNPVYKAEIESSLAELGVSARVQVV
ncbi:MAG: hypothetical protein RJA70_3701 [Pseudomonadota bacterium]